MRKPNRKTVLASFYFIHLGDLLLQLRFANIGTAGVDDVNDELSAAEQRVADELARSDLNR